MGVYVSAGISGGHLNPAVTLAMAISGKLNWKKVPIYMIAQYFGAFLGALFVYLIYYGKSSFLQEQTKFPHKNASFRYVIFLSNSI